MRQRGATSSPAVAAVLSAFLAGGCANASRSYELGQAFYLSGRYEQAAQHFREARRLDPTLAGIDEKLCRADLGVYLERGDEALRGGRWATAERAYEEARRLAPESEEVAARFAGIPHARADDHLRRGLDALAKGKPFEARAELEAAVDVQPDHARAREALARAQAEAGRRERGAEAAFEEARVAWERGRYDEAARLLARAIELDPRHAAARADLQGAPRRLAQVHLAAGDRHLELGEWAAAVAAYRRVRACDPSLPGLAARMLRAEREAAAEREVERADAARARREWRAAFSGYLTAAGLTQDPQALAGRLEESRREYAGELYVRARAAEGERRLAEALELYEALHAVEREHRDAEERRGRLASRERLARAAYQRGLAAFAARDLERAQRELDVCYDALPGYDDVSARRAEVRARLEEAEALYARARKAQARGDLQRARVLFEECLAVAAPFRDTRERMIEVGRRQEDRPRRRAR